MFSHFWNAEGFKEAAEKFRVEAGVSPTINLQTIDKRLLIRSHLQNGEIDNAVALINQIHPELLDNDNLLYFKIQVRILILYLQWVLFSSCNGKGSKFWSLIRQHQTHCVFVYIRNNMMGKFSTWNENGLRELSPLWFL